VAGLAVFFGLGALGWYDVGFVLRELPSGVGPAAISVEITSLAFALGFGLALPLAMLRAFPPGRRPTSPGSSGSNAGERSEGRLGRLGRRIAYGFATGYVATIRGTPFLVQVFLVYYAVIFAAPRFVLLGLTVPFWAGLLALTINTTGYQAEAMRGGFQSVDAAQIEAARALGLTRFQTFRRITFPQGIRLVTLPLTNEWISTFKTSAILSYISFVELFFWSRTDVAYQLGHPVEAFVLIVIFYLVINVVLSRSVSYLEERYRIPGLGTRGPTGTGRAAG